ncbi:MAG: xanthine dehydrogenase FAD-binding subunit XdhB [Desulfosarcinaceae bacterium]|nr:xanthine dehydrogenase FAD-binding subunit XdhB [Desulfosarcinaceae bacterium]
MFPISDYKKATTIEEALALMAEDPGLRPIAGGTDILIKLHKGKPGYDRLVDIHDVAALSGIRLNDSGDIVIGPGTVFNQVIANELIQTHLPVLATALATIGGPQVRNMGTIGGNLCNGVPSADSAPALLVFNATVTLRSHTGVRQLLVADFFKGPGEVDLAPGELLTAITIPAADHRDHFGHYIKYAMRDAMDIATIGCAAAVAIEGDRLGDLRLAFGVAAPVPIRCPAAEAAAKGRPLDGELAERVAAAVLSDVRPRDSWRAAKDFRLQIIGELARRALRHAVMNAGGRLPCDRP